MRDHLPNVSRAFKTAMTAAATILSVSDYVDADGVAKTAAVVLGLLLAASFVYEGFVRSDPELNQEGVHG